jgi:CheY-like chemotaxis protein
MKSIFANARVLIATDNLAEGDQLLRLLKEHFDIVALAGEQERAAETFHAQRVDVLVLAFETIALSQRYYLGLYRFAAEQKLHPHRTVLLCHKDEVQSAFELCKQQYFDDYVLYWPFAYDGLRLAMSVALACREMSTLLALTPQRSELRTHATHMAAFESTLEDELCAGEQRLAGARHSLDRLEQEIASAHDELARHVTADGAAGSPPCGDRHAWSQQVARVKSRQLAQARFAREQGLEPVHAWAAQLRNRIEPARHNARALAASEREGRLRLMAIDDDEMTRVLLARALHDDPYDILFATDAPAAVRQLQTEQPDVILMDVCLPGLDGISLTRLLKASAHLAAIPVIMMTGDSRRETVASSIDAGAAAFVVKPFTRQSLKKKLDEVLAR